MNKKIKKYFLKHKLLLKFILVIVALMIGIATAYLFIFIEDFMFRINKDTKFQKDKNIQQMEKYLKDASKETNG